MATEYYPLLARAVAGKRDAGERHAIYERARHALLGQLRSMAAVPEESITRESTALDAAIARLEADFADTAPAPSDPVTQPAAEPAAEAVSKPMPAAEAAGTAVAETTQVASPPAPEPPPAGAEAAPTKTPSEPAGAPAPFRPAPSAEAIPSVAEPKPAQDPPPAPEPAPAATAPAPASPSPGPAPAPTPPATPLPAPMPPRVAPVRPAADALTRIVAERPPAVPVIRVSRALDAPAGTSEATTRPPTPLPSAPRLQVPTFADAMAAADVNAPAEDKAETADATPPDKPRDEPLRPPAPRPLAHDRFNARALILVTVGLIVVAGIAYAAWRLRDKPESLARSQAMLAAQDSEQQSRKVVTRAGDAATGDTTASSGTAGTAAPAPPKIVAEVKAPAAPEPAAQPSASAVSPPAAAPASPVTGASSPPATPAAIPVSQRAAFLIDAPDEPSKVKTYVGTVVWSADNALPAQDQPISRVVRADVDVPDAGLKLTMVFQKNLEPQFPASHTLELHFTLQGDTVGAIKQINVPQMRKDDSPAGDPLVGLPVTITDNYFLVGLSRGEAVQRNLDLIKTRNWFDVPLLLASGKVAKITFEKGATGQQVIDAVMQSWQ